ncbi:exodeoxyribonuclease VII large subunit, partial [Rhodobacterales bacterium HKCCE3408]|nr:exodeoxyribonuclease VII large subunit [Rhodobacterales bacterium HKCCE3408]
KADLAAAVRGLARVGPLAPAEARRRLDTAARLLSTLGYTETLKRGYAVVRAEDKLVTRAEAAAGASALEIEFADGKVPVVPGPGSAAGGKRSGGTPRPGGGQGDLFGD